MSPRPPLPSPHPAAASPHITSRQDALCPRGLPSEGATERGGGVVTRAQRRSGGTEGFSRTPAPRRREGAKAAWGRRGRGVRRALWVGGRSQLGKGGARPCAGAPEREVPVGPVSLGVALAADHRGGWRVPCSLPCLLLWALLHVRTDRAPPSLSPVINTVPSSFRILKHSAKQRIEVSTV